MRRIIYLILIVTMTSLLPATSMGSRYASDGISFNIPHYNLQYQDAKLLRLGNYIQTTDYTCGPAAVMNLLYYYNMLTAHEMNKQTEMRLAREMGTTRDGTSLYSVEAWLSNNGFHVDYGTHITSDKIIDNINNGIPTFIIFDKHWMIARGYSNQTRNTNNDIIFNDTVSGTTIIPRDSLDTMWAYFQVSQDHKLGNPGYYIIAVPK